MSSSRWSVTSRVAVMHAVLRRAVVSLRCSSAPSINPRPARFFVHQQRMKRNRSKSRPAEFVVRTQHRSCKRTSPSANAATEEHPLHRDTSLVTRGSANPRIFFAYVILGQWCRCYWLLPQRAPCSYIHDRPGGPRPVAARRGAGGRCRTGPTRVVSARARRRLPSQARP